MAVPGSMTGYVLIDSVADVTIHVSRWTGNWSNRITDVTVTRATVPVAPTQAGTRYAGVVVDPQWTAEFPMDDPNFPEVMGFVPGTTIAAMYFKHGTSAKADKLEFTVVESIQKTNDATSDVPRVVVTGRGGDLTPNQALPA